MKTKNSAREFFTLRSIVGTMAVTALMTALPTAQAVTVLTGPTFTTATLAPLAGTLKLTTDTESRVHISVNDNIGTWERDFYDVGTNHSLILLGFKPNRTNLITVTVIDPYRNSFTVPTALTFRTPALPATMPVMTMRTNNPDLMEPGYTLFRVANQTPGVSYVLFVDSSGQIVWYSSGLATPSDIHQLTNGDLFFPKTDETGFTEANMLAQTVRTWSAPTGLLVDSHEDLMTPEGTILYITYAKQLVPNFPSSATVSNAPTTTANVSYNRVIEISGTNSALLNNWSLLAMLDPVRINYLPYEFAFYGIDPEHANAVIEDPRDNSLIVSMRNQDAIIKFTRSGQLKWILGPTNNWGPAWQPYLLTPVGSPFTYNYGQHAVSLTPQHTLLFFDDGNLRAEPWAPQLPDQDNYSRAVEFSVDETNMTVSQVWEYTGTNEDRLYADRVGNSEYQPQTGNVLIDYGYVLYENGTNVSSHSSGAAMIRLKEVTHDANPSLVFDLELFDRSNTSGSYLGNLVYRVHRVPDLYSHLAVPVQGLTVQLNGGQPLLQFSADPVRTYVVQASSDLVNWRDLGAPTPDDANGDYSFQDVEDSGTTAQFYRVITQ